MADALWWLCSKEDEPPALRERLNKPGVHKVHGAQWDVAAGEIPEHWKKANVTPVFTKGKEEDLGNCRLVRLTLSPRGDGSGNHFQVQRGEGGDREQPWIYEQENALSYLPAFCQERTGSVEQGTAAHAAYLHFGTAFDTASHHSLADKLVK